MLYPDKAYGQQAHGRTRVPVILRVLLLAVFLGVSGLPAPVAAETTILKKLRVGDHGAYTRVVFEFSAPVQYQLSETDSTSIVSIRFLDTASQLTGTPVPDAPDCIDAVSTLQDGSDTIANISFAPKGFKLNPFTVQGPDRMVLDVFCEAVPVAPVALTEPRDMAPSPIAVAEPAMEKPVSTPPSIKQAQPPEKGDLIAKKQEPSSKRDNSQKYLLLILAAITGIIVLLIALIIFQKRGLAESHLARDPDTTRETDDRMHAIDTKIKEELMKYDQ